MPGAIEIAQQRTYRIHVRTEHGKDETYRVYGPRSPEDASAFIRMCNPRMTVIHCLLIANPGGVVPAFIQGERDLGQFPAAAPGATTVVEENTTLVVSVDLDRELHQLAEHLGGALGFTPSTEQVIRHLIHHCNPEAELGEHHEQSQE